MPSTYSPIGRLELMATGENSGTWGDKDNTTYQLLETMVDGYVAVAFSADANQALTTANASADQARNKVVEVTGAITATRDITIPAVEKVYVVKNSTTGGQSIRVLVSGGTAVTIGNGLTMLLYCDATNCYAVSSNAAYLPGGADIALADGGTGASLADPGADRILFWDDSAGAVTWLTVGSGLSLTTTTLTTVVSGLTTAETAAGSKTGADTQFVTGTAGTTNDLVIWNVDGDVVGLTPPAGSLVGTTATQTLTNKTLTSPAINTATITTATMAGTWVASGTVTMPAFTAGSTILLADQYLSRPKMIDYSEAVNVIGATGGGTQDIDLELGNVVTATVNASANTFTFSNPSATGLSCSFTLILTNGGSQTVNWPAGTIWAAGTPPTLTTSGIDVLTFFTVNAGTTWYGFMAGAAMAT